ncbi:MAG TPA: DNA double-strand break repair nuclease NurA [Candidatus Aenigmarchaeota archaeon]|nr:MAG: hypothetical protein DRP03_00125 [Candidatus Aenigmarchaeota archaeon]HDD46069.1 DNA double-strand break repair nuclease NurA [Candidatus Aenigmarchaeota archaeon]
MDRIDKKIKEIAKKIVDSEVKRKKIAYFLREIGDKMGIFNEVEKIAIKNLKVVGVDGGIAKKSLHGFDFIVTRAVATYFRYSKGRLTSVNYFPSKSPIPAIKILEALSDLDWSYSISISRQMAEISVAIAAVKKFKPDLLLLDGSVVPHYTDRPSRSSAIYEAYVELINLYKELFDTTTAYGIIIAGVIEDSRGNRFGEIIEEKVLSEIKNPLVNEVKKMIYKTRDTNLLFWALKKGERSLVFDYAREPESHPILREFPEYMKRIKSFYLKTSRFDRPIRVDFIGEDFIADRLSSIIFSLSCYHDGYGLPSVLIEADNAAKLKEDDAELIYNAILSETGMLPSVLRMRRENRPF